MRMNDIEKKNYIKNNFHQYFDLVLNKSIDTTETVNLIIPIDKDLRREGYSNIEFTHDKTYEEGYDINKILNNYENTSITENLIGCFLSDPTNKIPDPVIDGDTFHVKIPSMEGTKVNYTYEKVRLVGINTPEMPKDNEEEKEGASVSKEFLKKALESTNKIYLKVDEKRPRDNYGRLLAVVIVNKKNINEILLKERLAEIWYIPPSEFNPYDWIDINELESDIPVHIPNFKTTDISILSSYFNSDMTNLVFTPIDDYNTFYSFEVYQGVIFVKLNPYHQQIRMHLLPKHYEGDSTVLLFRDDMIKPENISLSDDYIHYEETPINSYYTTENKIRNRNDPDISSENYNVNDWLDKNTFCDFSYNISKSTQHLNKLQICAGYRYNNSTPFYSLHYTGVRDNTGFTIEDRCTLIDANYDRIKPISNNITQYHYIDDENILYIPKSPIDIKASYPQNFDHVSQIEETNHKILKYINDILYSEENKEYAIAEWVDLSKEE